MDVTVDATDNPHAWYWVKVCAEHLKQPTTPHVYFNSDLCRTSTTTIKTIQTSDVIEDRLRQLKIFTAAPKCEHGNVYPHPVLMGREPGKPGSVTDGMVRYQCQGSPVAAAALAALTNG